jgi:SAM-dependent methyltransferase
MKWLDRFLQRWRMGKVRPYIRSGARVLDVGCADGALFEFYRKEIKEGIGLDPALAEPRFLPNARLFPGSLRDCPPLPQGMDVITLLAVVEHLSETERASLASECAPRLRPGGYLIITVPSPRVDAILAGLAALRLIDGMKLHEHHGFDPSAVVGLFAQAPFELLIHCRFELGLNHLFVFRRLD